MASGSENDEQRRFQAYRRSSLLLRSAFIIAMRAGIIKSRPSAQLVSMVAASSTAGLSRSRLPGGSAAVARALRRDVPPGRPIGRS